MLNVLKLSDMKRLLMTLSLILVASVVSAQNHLITRADVYLGNEGLVFPDLTTRIAVDVTVASEEFVAGPYARYAQKYLGVRASLSDKTTHEITSAEISLLDGASFPVAGQLPEDKSYSEGYFGSDREYARILPDRLNAGVVTTEQAAQSAANEIFRLRRQRLDLISGEEGENVFGAGLKAALDELYALENAYTSLFLGKRVVSTTVRRYVVLPDAEHKSYIVCRFSEVDGLLPSNDLSGDVVLLQIRPSGKDAVQGLREAGEKEQSILYRVADNSECLLIWGTSEIAHSVLPLYPFGRNVKVALPQQGKK